MNNELFYALLKETTAIPGLWSQEEQIVRYIEDFAKQYSVEYTLFPGDGIVLGSIEAPLWTTAHVDEVGAYISYNWPEWIHIEWVWWVSPSMYIGRDIEIYTQKWIVEWIIIAKPLITQVDSFRDLTILVDPDDKKNIKRWDQLRLKTIRNEKEKSVFSSVVDNRLWVVQLLHHVLYEWKDCLAAWKIAYCFTTEEEIRNKWAVKLFSALEKKPWMLIINDILPYGKMPDMPMSRPLILIKSNDYVISEEVKNTIDIDYFPMMIDDWSMNRSEAMQLWNITWWNTIHFFTPIYNYHHWTYFFEKKHIEHCSQQLYVLIQRFLDLS